MSQRSYARLVMAAASAVLFVVACRDDTVTAPIVHRPQRPGAATATGITGYLVGAGDIARCGTSYTGDSQTAQLILNLPNAAVYTLGDNANNGSDSDYANCYGPTWGQFKDRTHPVPGNRDYSTSGAPGYFNYFGAAAGTAGQGYYSYDIGSWHIIALNSNISMSAGSAQETWLKHDLAASTAPCTLAYWHYPRFYSYGSGIRSSVLPLWNDLYAAGAEIVANGDDRFYERFAPQTPAGALDTVYGIREFVAATGGYGFYDFGTVAPNSEVRNTGTFGVLEFTLTDTGYVWQFIGVPGSTFSDSGFTRCHTAPPPLANAGIPAYSTETTVLFDGRSSSSPQGYTPITYLWNFGDGTTSTAANPTHTYTVNGGYAVTLTVTDSHGDVSAPDTAMVTIGNTPPLVNAGLDQTITPGATMYLHALISDLGQTDSPWTYAITWGDGGSYGGSLTSLTSGLTVGHMYLNAGTYTVHVTVTDKDGASSSDDMVVTVSTTAPPDPVILAAGDIASCDKTIDDQTANLLDGMAGIVVPLGDNVYPHGEALGYANCYGPTWGRQLARTYAVIGNHDYETTGAAPAYDYFGPHVGPRGKGFYSFDAGTWHVVVLNQYVSTSSGSEQEKWLRTDLAATAQPCILAMWHEPYFFSASSDYTLVPKWKILWRDLYAAHADVILNGHVHFYERFAPSDTDGNADTAGIREFVVGTGGYSIWSMPTNIRPNSEKVISNVGGVMQLTLHANSYSWNFVPVAGKTASDTGTTACH